MTGHARAIGLGGKGNHTLDMGTVGSGSNHHRATKGMSDHHHRLVSTAFQIRHASKQVEGALKYVIGLPVVQPQGRNAIANELLGHSGVGAGARSAEPAARSADPNDGLVGIRCLVQDGVEVTATSPKLQTFTNIAIR